MGRRRRRHDQSVNNAKKIPKRYKKNNSTSLSVLLTTGAYKKRIKDLIKNNRNLAFALERAHIQVAEQKEQLKNCVKDSNQMMYARAKLKDIATTIHQLVTDLNVVVGFLDIGTHLKNIKYYDQLSDDGSQQDLRMRIADPSISLIEEASSIEEETSTSDCSTTLDTATTKSPQPEDSPLPDRIDEHHESPVSGENLCDFGSPGNGSHLSLTPVLEIQPIVFTSRCSTGRNSRLCLKNAKTRVSEKKPPQRESVESKESVMRISNDVEKIQKLSSSLSKVTQVERKTIASSCTKPTILNGVATIDPIDSAVVDTMSLAQKSSLVKDKYVSVEPGSDAPPLSEFPNKMNHTLVMCEDMELTEVIPSDPSLTVAGENNFQGSSKSSALESKITQSKYKNDHLPECERKATSESKSVVNSPMVYNQHTPILSRERFVDEKSVISNGVNGIVIKEYVAVGGIRALPLATDSQNADTQQGNAIQERENAATPITSIENNSVAKRKRNKSTVAPRSRLENQNILESEVSSGESNSFMPKSKVDVLSTTLSKTDMQKTSEMKYVGKKKSSKSKSTEPGYDKTHSISCGFESNEGTDSSCQEIGLNQSRLKRAKNTQYNVFFSSDSDTDSSISTPSSTTKSRRLSTCKSKRVTVIPKSCTTTKSNTKQDEVKSSLEANTEMKVIGNVKARDSSSLPDTAIISNKSLSHAPDRDIYDFDSSNPNSKRVLSAENLGKAMLDTKSSKSDKGFKNKKFFPSKQNCKKDVSVVNIANSFPRSHSENDENFEKFNSNKSKPDAIVEADVSSESVDSERELNPLGRKRVSFAALDSVYKFKRNSAVMYCNKRSTAQCTKNIVSSDSEESSTSGLDEQSVIKDGKEDQVLTFSESIKKGQHPGKKLTNETEKNHVMQSKEIGQCLKDKTVVEVDHPSLIHCGATKDGMNFNDETEIYTFVPAEPEKVEESYPVDSKPSMITVRRSKNQEYNYSFDISNTDLQVSHTSKLLSKPVESSETNKLLVENSALPHTVSLNPQNNSTELMGNLFHAKPRMKNIKLGSNVKKIIKSSAANEHNNDILCSSVTNNFKSSRIAQSGIEQNFVDDEDKSVTGLGSLVSEIQKATKGIKTNREKNNKASKDCLENVLPEDDIVISDEVKQASVREKSALAKDIFKNHVKNSKTPKHKNPLKEKNDFVLEKGVDSTKCILKENKKKAGLTTEQVKTKTVPESFPTFELQQSNARDSKITQEVKKLSSTDPDQDMATNDENLLNPRSSLNDDRPKRRSKPVCYKEPTLNKKMRRQS